MRVEFGTMRHLKQPARSAPIAIAAILALGSIPAAAQDASAFGPMAAPDPVPIVPESPLVSPVGPVTAPPTPPQAATVSNPVVQEVPVPPEPVIEEPAAEQPAAAPVATPRNAATETRTAVAAPVETTAASIEAPAEESEIARVAAPPLPMTAAEPAATDTPERSAIDWASFAALALAGLIPVGLIALALIWWRRRSRRVASAPAKPVVRRVRKPEPALSMVSTAPVVETEPRVPVDTPLPAETPPEPANGQVILPRKLPETFEERSALMRRMVAAAPDRANPFRSPKARAKRARLILQSLGRKFERRKPRIDLSQYGYIWPHLAEGRPANIAA